MTQGGIHGNIKVVFAHTLMHQPIREVSWVSTKRFYHIAFLLPLGYTAVLFKNIPVNTLKIAKRKQKV